MVSVLLDSLRISLCLTFLSIASLYDLRFREVPNIIWIISAPIGLVLSMVSLAINTADQISNMISWIITLIIVSGLSLTLFYLDLWGGADAKAMICLAISMPTHFNIEPLKPILNQSPRQVFSLPISISILNNSVLAAALLTVVIALRNLVDLVRSNGRIFERLEKTSLLRKALAFITGYRVEAEKLRSGKHHYMIIEEFNLEDGGSLKRSLRIFRTLSANNEIKSKIPGEINGKIWVTPALPFLLFMEAGLMITVLLGDIIFWLAFNLLELI